jgi:hypothetical protein
MFEFDLVSRPHEEGSWRRSESPRLQKRASILSELRANAKQSNIQTCSEALREGTRDKRDLPVRRFARMAPNSRALCHARFIDEMPAPPLPF